MSGSKKRAVDGVVKYNVTDLQPTTTYNLTVSVIREGLGGEGPEGPPTEITTLPLRKLYSSLRQFMK